MTNATHNPWVCMASGWSLTQEDVDYCRGRAHIAVANSTFYRCPDVVEIIHGADYRWWERHIDAVRRLTDPQRCRYFTTSTKAAKTWGLEQVIVEQARRTPRHRHTASTRGTSVGWSSTPGRVMSGGLTGYQLTQIVGWQKPSKLILLGYDMCKGPDGAIHHHADHEPPFTNMPKMRQQVPFFDALARQAKLPIINCSPGTILRCFPRRPLRQVLK